MTNAKKIVWSPFPQQCDSSVTIRRACFLRENLIGSKRKTDSRLCRPVNAPIYVHFIVHIDACAHVCDNKAAGVRGGIVSAHSRFALKLRTEPTVRFGSNSAQKRSRLLRVSGNQEMLVP